MTNPQQALGQNAFPLAASDIITQGWQLSGLAGVSQLGAGHQLPEPSGSHLDPGRQLEGGQWAPVSSTAAIGMAGGKEGLPQPLRPHHFVRGRKETPDERGSPHPAFRIPDMCSWGLASWEPARPPCAGGQGARVRPWGTHACPASPAGAGPRCLLTVRGSMAASGGVSPDAPLAWGLPCGCMFTAVQEQCSWPLPSLPRAPQGQAPSTA